MFHTEMSHAATAHPIKQKDVCWLGDALGQKRAARPEVGAQASSALANLRSHPPQRYARSHV